jgi:hypothetical protein
MLRYKPSDVLIRCILGASVATVPGLWQSAETVGPFRKPRSGSPQPSLLTEELGRSLQLLIVIPGRAEAGAQKSIIPQFSFNIRAVLPPSPWRAESTPAGYAAIAACFS